VKAAVHYSVDFTNAAPDLMTAESPKLRMLRLARMPSPEDKMCRHMLRFVEGWDFKEACSDHSIENFHMSFKQECQELLDHYVTCYQRGDAKGCASIYAVNAELYSPFGPSAVGRKAIEKTHAEWVAEGADGKQISVISASREGGLGWCVAEFSEGSTGEGVSLNVLLRQPDGSWLITHCSLNEMQS